MMTERIRNLKDFICSFPPEVFADRAEIITDSYKRTEGMPSVLRRAVAFRDILEKIDIHIGDLERVVGALSGYLCQGYYGMSLCMRVPWEPGAGIGHSMALINLFDRVSTVAHVSSYQYRIAELFGWQE